MIQPAKFIQEWSNFMNTEVMRLPRSCRPLIIVFAILLFSFGCGGSGSSGGGGDGSASVISGKVTGVDARGAGIELLDKNGRVLASTDNAVDGQGEYRLAVTGPLPKSDYFCLRLVKGQAMLRTMVTGYTGQATYDALDTQISPESEAAFILCGLTPEFNFSEYAAFLRAMADGEFDPEDVLEAGVYFHEIIDDVALLVAEDFEEGVAATDLFVDICNLIEQQSHRLDADLPPGSEPGSLIHRAFVTRDRSGLLFAGYDPRNSTINLNNPVNLLSTDQEDGSFIWKEFALDLGGNVISSLDLTTGEISALVQAANVFALDPDLRALALDDRLMSEDSPARFADTRSLFQNVTGVLNLASSNVSRLLDIDGSGLSTQGDNTSASFKVVFRNTVKASDISIGFLLEDEKGKTTPLQTVVVVEGDTFSSSLINLVAPANQNNKIIANIKSRGSSLYRICDAIDKTRYQDSFPMIAAKSMSETRADPDGTDFYNNLPKTHDNGLQPQVTGNTYSHYIIDLDRVLGQGVVPAWDKTAYGQNPPHDSGRLPLILVHGWQGDHHTRSAAQLSFWSYSPVRYFYKFIAYYLTTPELNTKYHVYLVRWPSYKHLTFNADMLGRMLQSVKGGFPNGDLGMAMTDQTKGLTFITHSTGGLIVRTAIESHGAASDGTDPDAFLRGAILLAGPNHGTQLATNMIPNNLLKDVSTQSSSDLQWDSFDGKTWVLAYPYWLDRIVSRWPSGVENVKQFDKHYLGQLDDPNTSTFNPWLLWLNQMFAKGAPGLRGKYILYSGWTRLWPHSADFLDNSISLNVAEAFLKLVGGLQNDSVLPNCSTLMATGKQDAVYLDSFDLPTIDSYPHSAMYFLDGAPIITMGASADHPLDIRFRLFMDYSHLQLNGGAFAFELTDRLMTEPDVLPAAVDTDWWKESDRRAYVQTALTIKNGRDPGQITQFMNPLKFEPLFLTVTRDLIDLAD
jgi:pimeloyl-ACP methyl ester carboxylesterase